MTAVHILMAIVATWRLTEIVTADRISSAFRQRFPHYFWTCTRCVSVWAGGFATLALIYLPWLNWPFALSWLFIAHSALLDSINRVNAKRIAIDLDGYGGIQMKRWNVEDKTVIPVLRSVLQNFDRNGDH